MGRFWGGGSRMGRLAGQLQRGVRAGSMRTRMQRARGSLVASACSCGCGQHIGMSLSHH